MAPIAPAIRKLEEVFGSKIRATVSQDTPFTYEIQLPTNSTIRFSGFGSFFTITNHTLTAGRDIEQAVKILTSHGFSYIDEAGIGPPLSERSDLTEDNLFNRLFGYYT